MYLPGYARAGFWIGASLYYACIVVGIVGSKFQCRPANPRGCGRVIPTETGFDIRVREPGVEEYL